MLILGFHSLFLLQYQLGSLKQLINFNWRLVTSQYCGGFFHTLTWISHGCTCVSCSHLDGNSELYLCVEVQIPHWMVDDGDWSTIFSKRPGRSETEPELGIQMQKPWPRQLKVEFGHLMGRQQTLQQWRYLHLYIFFICSPHLLINTFLTVTLTSEHICPWELVWIKQGVFPADLQFPRDELRHQVYLILIINSTPSTLLVSS